jgi:hypothetical protein
MLDFLKVNYILPWIARRAVKRRSTPGQSIHYPESSSILVIFTMRGNDSVKKMRWLQEQFVRDGKNVTFIYLLLQEDYKPDVHLDKGMIRIEQKDLSFWGDILNEKAKKILNQDFDYLIHADLETNVYADIILSQNAAKCRIGRRFEGHDLFYEFMIDIGSNKRTQYLLEQIYFYTKAL